MKNSRLFEILYLLVEKRAITAGELAERLEVSERTIYRDVDALSAAEYAEEALFGGLGVPVQVDEDLPQSGGASLFQTDLFPFFQTDSHLNTTPYPTSTP